MYKDTHLSRDTTHLNARDTALKIQAKPTKWLTKDRKWTIICALAMIAGVFFLGWPLDWVM